MSVHNETRKGKRAFAFLLCFLLATKTEMKCAFTDGNEGLEGRLKMRSNRGNQQVYTDSKLTFLGRGGIQEEDSVRCRPTGGQVRQKAADCGGDCFYFSCGFKSIFLFVTTACFFLFSPSVSDFFLSGRIYFSGCFFLGFVSSASYESNETDRSTQERARHDDRNRKRNCEGVLV